MFTCDWTIFCENIEDLWIYIFDNTENILIVFVIFKSFKYPQCPPGLLEANFVKDWSIPERYIFKIFFICNRKSAIFRKLIPFPCSKSVDILNPQPSRSVMLITLLHTFWLIDIGTMTWKYKEQWCGSVSFWYGSGSRMWKNSGSRQNFDTDRIQAKKDSVPGKS